MPSPIISHQPMPSSHTRTVTTPFGQFYSIPGAETVIRGALRYQGLALVDLDWLIASVQPWLDRSLIWADMMKKTISAVAARDQQLTCYPLRPTRDIHEVR
ncbi:hypothetical protein AX14_004966 [Amanita brunnescens Koide BX004]|nr:hypothetical protein AX14_004966 [Amanita brunnescens Koide BX004]